jgi:hypothetical protein
MPAKKQTKSRTSQSKANKRISAPRWVIAVVLLIVAGTGAFLVYRSFAATGSPYQTNLYCRNNQCWTSPQPGLVVTTVYVRYNSACRDTTHRQWTLQLGTKGNTNWRCIATALGA